MTQIVFGQTLNGFYDVDGRLLTSKTARTGVERLSAWIAAWGSYIPNIYGVAKALMAMKDSDEEAMTAWKDRMHAVREGCAAAITALRADGRLREDLSEEEATDMLWTLLSVRSWEQLRLECGWSPAQYVDRLQKLAARALVKR